MVGGFREGHNVAEFQVWGSNPVVQQHFELQVAQFTSVFLTDFSNIGQGPQILSTLRTRVSGTGNYTDTERHRVTHLEMVRVYPTLVWRPLGPELRVSFSVRLGVGV